MMIRPRNTKALRSRLFTTLLCGALLVLGTGCVSWDPIFRGSARLVSLLRSLV
ncbi:MAG: hypothetical protein AAGA25_15060 [Planctomycetota bacterium]